MLKAISERHKLEPNGEPSLQNAIEMARSSMRFAAFFYRYHRFAVNDGLLLPLFMTATCRLTPPARC